MPLTIDKVYASTINTLEQRRGEDDFYDQVGTCLELNPETSFCHHDFLAANYLFRYYSYCISLRGIRSLINHLSKGNQSSFQKYSFYAKDLKINKKEIFFREIFIIIYIYYIYIFIQNGFEKKLTSNDAT